MPELGYLLTMLKAFFWAGLATLTLTWGYFRLFETKGRTFGELDFMVRVPNLTTKEDGANGWVKFQKNVPARKSASYQIPDEEIFTAQESEKH
jgi:SP family general alpha glucoside:H+ symporter-like MFS transporter